MIPLLFFIIFYKFQKISLLYYYIVCNDQNLNLIKKSFISAYQLIQVYEVYLAKKNIIMNKNTRLLRTGSQQLVKRKQFGVGDYICYQHKQVMNWIACYMDGKFFLSTPQKYKQLLEIQRQIQAEKQLASQYQNDEKQKAQSVKAFDSHEHHQLSTITQVNHKKMKMNQMKVQQELQEQQYLNLKRIKQVRISKKEDNKIKNLIKVPKKQLDELTQRKLKQQDDKNYNLDQKSAKNRIINHLNRQPMHQNIFEDKKVQQINQLQPIFITKKQNTVKSIKVSQEPLKIIVVQPQKEQRAGNQFFYNIHSQIDQLSKNIHVKQQERGQVLNNLQTDVNKGNYKINHKQDIPYRYEPSQAMKNTKEMLRDLNKQLRQIGLVDTSPQMSIVSQHQSQKWLLSLQDQKQKSLIDNKDEHKLDISEIKNNQHNLNLKQIQNKHVEQFLASNNAINDIGSSIRQKKPIKQAQLGIKQSYDFKKNKKLSLMPCIVNYQLHESSIQQPKIKEQNIIVPNNQDQKEKLHQEIVVLKQVIGQIRVQRLKYKVKQRQQDETKTVNNHYQKEKTPNSSNLYKVESSHRVSGSIFHNFDESAVSQFKTNNLSSFNKNSPGKIVKNKSIQNTFRRSQINHKNSKNTFTQQQTKKEERGIIIQNQHDASQKGQTSEQVSKIISHDQIRDQQQIEKQRNPTYKQNINQNNVDGKYIQNKSNSIQLLSIYPMVQSNLDQFNKSSNKRSTVLEPPVRNDNKYENNIIQNSQFTESPMPKPLSKHNAMNPPKFVIHQHRNHQKLHEEKMKKKLLNNFQQLQKIQRASAVSSSKEKTQPKKRAIQDGVIKTIQSSHKDIIKEQNLKNNIPKSQTNLKKKIYEIQISKQDKNFQNKNIVIQNKNLINDTPTKNFRLRRDSLTDKRSRISSLSNKSSKSQDFRTKRIQNNIYVPGVQQINYHTIQTPKTLHNNYKQQPFEQVQKSLGHKQFIKKQQAIQQDSSHKYANKTPPSFEVKFEQFSSNMDTKSAKIYKVEKRKIVFTKAQFPILPEAPKQNTNIAQMMSLIKSIGIILQIDLKIGELNKIIMKKYKNCIMLDIPNVNLLKLVWNYSGKFYIGDWNEQTMLKSGSGIEIIPNKSYYKGQFSQGKRHGSGIMISSNGNIYQGQWFEGEKSGRGKYYDHGLKTVYEGQWNQGKRQGYGYLCVQNQSIYEGTFLLNYRHGFGTQQFQNGDRYRGEYIKGRFHGKGLFCWASGDCYQGDFFEGSKNGQGKWCSESNQQYKGQYFYDKKHGQGRFKWSNGCIYQGQFQNDKQNGIGVLIYPNDRKIKGIWKEGKIDQIFQQSKGLLKQDPLTPIKSKGIETTTIFRAVQKHSSQKQQSFNQNT